MIITRKQLRRIIKESLNLVTEAADPFSLSDQEKDKLIAGIDWAACQLPDASNWQGYTKRVYGWSKKAKSTTVAKQQFVGAVTVPVYWESLVLTADTWVKDLAMQQETHDWWDYSSGYDNYVKFYNNYAKGKKVHSREFNELFLDTFMDAYKSGMDAAKGRNVVDLSTPSNMAKEKARMEEYLNKTIQHYIEKGCIPEEARPLFNPTYA